jgi:hypothetical protein
MGIGSSLKKLGRKIDDYTVQLSKDVAQDALDFATGKDQENKARAAIIEANKQATIAAENASQPVVQKYKIDFEGTIKAARAAGINPLTALRTVGSNTESSTTQFHAPILTSMPAKSSYFERAFNVGKLYFGYKDFQSQRAISATNTRLEQDYIRSQTRLNNFNTQTAFDPYAGRTSIPVQVGFETKQLEVSVARRLNILPGDTLMPGELSEIQGEFWGEIGSAFATNVQDAIISGGTLGTFGSYGSDPKQLLKTQTYSEWSAEQSAQTVHPVINVSKLPVSKSTMDKARTYGIANPFIRFVEEALN